MANGRDTGSQPRLDERSIRNALLTRLRAVPKGWLAHPEFRIVPVVHQEIGILQGRGRLDVLKVTDRVHGYEIKSEKDHLTRLAQQARLYGQVADRMSLVTTPRHHQKALALIPIWWEVIVATVVDGEVQLKQHRPPRSNRHQDPRALVEFLWLEEARHFLKQRGRFRRLSGKPRRVLWDRIAEDCRMDDIRWAVAQALRTPTSERPTTTVII